MAPHRHGQSGRSRNALRGGPGFAEQAGRPGLALMVALLGVPLFVMVSPAGGVALPTGTSMDDRANLLSVPVSLLLVGLLVAGTPPHRPLHRAAGLAPACLALFVFLNVLAFIVGSMINGLSVLSLAFLAQTFLPMVGFIAGRRIGQFDHRWIRRVLMRMAVVTMVAFLGVALTTFAYGGRPWVYVGEALGPFGIPQARRFLPTVVAFTVIFFARSALAGRVTFVRVLSVAAVTFFLLASHSRTALVILAVALVMFAIFDARAHLTHRVHFLLLAGIFAGLLWAAWGSIDLQNAPEALSRFSSSNASAQLSSDRREAALRDSIAETFTSPLGRMYEATTSESLGGQQAAHGRVSNSENQLGEYGLRAGPLALIAVAVGISSILVRSRASLRSVVERAPAMEALWLSCSATIIGSVFTQPSLSQPYTGVVLWFGLGTLVGWSNGRPESGRRPWHST